MTVVRSTNIFWTIVTWVLGLAILIPITIAIVDPLFKMIPELLPESTPEWITSWPWWDTVVAIILIAAILWLIRIRPGVGVFLLILAILVWWLGFSNVSGIGRNIGSGLLSVSGGEDQSSSATGEITLARVDNFPELFVLGTEYRRVEIPPGKELCADPIDKVEVGNQSTVAVKYVRSATTAVEEVHFYYLPYGCDCRTDTNI